MTKLISGSITLVVVMSMAAPSVRPDESFASIVFKRTWCLGHRREMGYFRYKLKLLKTSRAADTHTYSTYLSKGTGCANTEVRVTATS